ncbi:sugar ABC transporter ATP-binding protein [Lachnoclostridium phytofermentans]|uniref:ABC transporter related n=1 Tax=Lachnoclostridium phytofermentans (strain ATCC 700394 / DSM 18823 / ISDg) TaxID=357809 RepID=A9KMR7_LACP7|nr:sugar ABC transporter ATP-binding protein [Lachnoclostridium phytofermentans]ABX41512.1 ABC transporter related [Lachnoclostridium phytofermentans ISDg]
MSEELFRMEGISKSFPGVKALDNVSLSVNKGEVHGLVGENGAGKSTLMKIMTGVYQADKGDIYIENEKVVIDSVAKAHEYGISIIFQELTLCRHLTVADNIFIGRPPVKGVFISDKQMHREAKKILDNLGININTHTMVSTLSVAQQQMVEIAKAISYNSRILVLDEPTATLTEREIEQLFVIIRNLQKKGVGMVYISHRMDELKQICERATVIRDGQYIGTRSLSDITLDELVNMIVGRSLEDKFPKYERKIGDVALEVRNLHRGNKVNVDHLKVHKGEILGISGLVGAGRTEIMRCIFGADKADSMELTMDGVPVTINSVAQAIKHGLAYATEDRKYDGLALDLDIEYNTNMAHLHELSRFGFINDKEGAKNAEKYRRLMNTKTPTLRKPAGQLSGGNQQKIVLSKWMCNDIKVLIVDEPTRGIDVGAKFEIYQIFNKLSDSGVAIIMISSELPEVLGMSDRVLVIHEGSINGELDAKKTSQEEILYLAAGYNKLEGKPAPTIS